MADTGGYVICKDWETDRTAVGLWQSRAKSSPKSTGGKIMAKFAQWPLPIHAPLGSMCTAAKSDFEAASQQLWQGILCLDSGIGTYSLREKGVRGLGCCRS